MNVAWLLVLALPEDPAAALEQLGRFGAVPECTAQERIEKTEHDHAHHFSPPAALPALEGKYSQLLPFLEHPNRRVVLRAVALMCRTGDPRGPAQVAALARRFPCEHELNRSATAMALSDVGLADCKDPPEPIWRAPARTLAKWKKPAHAATAKAISSGEIGFDLTITCLQVQPIAPCRVGTLP